MLANSIAGLPRFALYFGLGLGLIALYLTVYMWATVHNELALIKRNVTSAGVALGLSLLGFAIPLSSAIIYSQHIVDMAVWGLVALVVQIVAYYLIRLILPDLSQRISDNEMGAALFVGSASVAAGMLNAASMSF